MIACQLSVGVELNLSRFGFALVAQSLVGNGRSLAYVGAYHVSVLVYSDCDYYRAFLVAYVGRFRN